MRPERLSWWLAGLVVGAGSLLVLLLAFVVGLPVIVVVGLVGIVLARNLAFTSGLLIGFGGTGTALVARAVIDCAVQDLLPNQGCEAQSVTPFVLVVTALLVIGVVLGLLARRRTRAASDGGDVPGS
jgi:hypothetical protein